MKPKIAMCDIFPDMNELRGFALDNGFTGVDYSFELEKLPKRPIEESTWVKDISQLSPLEVRFHCPFHKIDLGHNDPEKAGEAETIFQSIIRLLSKAGGKILSIHIGLGRNSTEPLSWDATIDKLRNLVQYGSEHGIMVCLENLAWGWTSKPNLFEKLIRKSNAYVTFDIGHARVCESVRNHYYSVEDFVTPHTEKVINAHIYDKEIEGVGHLPPDHLTDIKKRLSLLMDIGCDFWVIEVKEIEGLLKTKKIIDEYLKSEYLEKGFSR